MRAIWGYFIVYYMVGYVFVYDFVDEGVFYLGWFPDYLVTREYNLARYCPSYSVQESSVVVTP